MSEASLRHTALHLPGQLRRSWSPIASSRSQLLTGSASAELQMAGRSAVVSHPVVVDAVVAVVTVAVRRRRRRRRKQEDT